MRRSPSPWKPVKVHCPCLGIRSLVGECLWPPAVPSSYHHSQPSCHPASEDLPVPGPAPAPVKRNVGECFLIVLYNLTVIALSLYLSSHLTFRGNKSTSWLLTIETRLLVLVKAIGMILVAGWTFSASQEELEMIVAGGGWVLRWCQTDLDILLTNILSMVVCCSVVLLVPG